MWWFTRSAIPCCLYSHFTPIQDIAIHFVHCILSIPSIEEPNEGKSPRLFSETVSRYVYVTHISIALENRLELFRGDSVGEVVHFQTHHTSYVGGSSPFVWVARVATTSATTLTPVPPSASTPVSITTPAPATHSKKRDKTVTKHEIEIEKKLSQLSMRRKLKDGLKVRVQMGNGGFVALLNHQSSPSKEEAESGDHNGGIHINYPPPHTIIEHTHTPSSQTKPEDCIQGAEIGDKLTVHYTVNKVMCPSFCTKHMPYSRVHSPAEKFLTALVREILSPLNSELNKSFQVAPHCFPSGE